MSLQPDRIIIIRADAGGDLGTGHVMRMIALGQACLRMGGKVRIVCSRCPAGLSQRIIDEGIEFQKLDTAELGSRRDLDETLALATEYGAEWLVLDGYHFDFTYQLALKEQSFKVVAVDDYGHSTDWACDVLLNQNFGSENWNLPRRFAFPCQLMLGSQFALLRSEFLQSPPRAHGSCQTAPIQHILLTLGGVDLGNTTGRILKLLEEIEEPPLKVRVLVGMGNPNLAVLEDQQSRHDVQVIVNAKDMPAQFDWADGVISAGGSTCWEWMYYRLPGAVVTIADNQVPVVEALAKKRLALDLGWDRDLKPGVSTNLLKEWIEKPGNIIDVSELSRVIDGRGCERAASYLTSGLLLRQATDEDCELYFKWVNDAAVRKNALNSREILWEEHKKWFHQRVTGREAKLYVLERLGTPVGQVRFELKQQGLWEIGISIDSGARGSGLGLVLLEKAMGELLYDQSGQLTIEAQILTSNLASLSLFRAVGFEEISNGAVGVRRCRLSLRK